MKNETSIAIVFPHPDDESFGTVQTIRNFREENVPVTYICGTLGEMGRNMGSPTFANRESLPDLRKRELSEVCQRLDIDLKLLGFRDKTMEFEHKETVIEKIGEALTDVKPSLVITFYPGYGIHPDHNTMGELTIEACRRMDKTIRPTVWAVAISFDHESALGQADIKIPVTDFQYKLETILTHRTQTENLRLAVENPVEYERVKRELGIETYYIWDFEA